MSGCSPSEKQGDDSANTPRHTDAAHIPDVTCKGRNDSNFTRKWKRYFIDARDNTSSVETVHRLGSILRRALSNGDYIAELCDQMKCKQEEDERRIADLEAENRQLKRERHSLLEQVREYEELERFNKREEEMLKSKIYENNRMNQPSSTPEELFTDGKSPSVAQLKKYFTDQGDISSKPPKPYGTTPPAEPRQHRGVYQHSIKYARRSKSVTRPIGILKKPNYI